MDYWKGISTVGCMVLIFIGIVIAWYAYHIIRPIAGYYLHYHITKWLNIHEPNNDVKN